MSVKKDLNQERMELDAINREYKNVSDRLNAYETNAEVEMHLAKFRDALLRARDETRMVMQQRDELKGQAEGSRRRYPSSKTRSGRQSSSATS